MAQTLPEIPNPILAAAAVSNPSPKQAPASSASSASGASAMDINAALTAGNPSSLSYADQLALARKSLEASNKKTDIALAKLTKQAAAATSSGHIIESAINEAAAAHQTISLVKETAAMKAENNTATAFKAAGGSPLQVKLMTTLGTEVANINKLQAEKAKIESQTPTGIGIIDDIINKFSTHSIRADLTDARAARNITSNNLTAISNATTQIKQANIAAEVNINDASIAANSNLIAADANIKAQQAHLNTINANAKLLSTVMTANRQQQQSMLSVLSLEDKALGRELQVSNLAITKDRQKQTKELLAFQKEKLAFNKKKQDNEISTWDTKTKILDAKLAAYKDASTKNKELTPLLMEKNKLQIAALTKAKEDLKVSEDSMVERVHRAQAFYGIGAKGQVEPNASIMQALKRRDSRYLALLEKGGSSDMSYGSSPADALDNFALVSPTGSYAPNRITKLLATIKQAQDYFLNTPIKNKAGVSTGKLPKVPHTKEAKDALFNSTAYSYLATQAANIVAGDATNPYQAPSMAILTKSDDLALDPLYTNVLEHTKMTDTNPQAIVDAAVSGVLAKKVSIEQAAQGIKAIFHLSALINSSEDNGFRSIGLPSQTSYNTAITMPASLGAKIKFGIKLANSASIFSSTDSSTLYPDSNPMGAGTAAPKIIDLIDIVKVRSMLNTILSSKTK